MLSIDSLPADFPKRSLLINNHVNLHNLAGQAPKNISYIGDCLAPLVNKQAISLHPKATIKKVELGEMKLQSQQHKRGEKN